MACAFNAPLPISLPTWMVAKRTGGQHKLTLYYCGSLLGFTPDQHRAYGFSEWGLARAVASRFIGAVVLRVYDPPPLGLMIDEDELN